MTFQESMWLNAIKIRITSVSTDFLLKAYTILRAELKRRDGAQKGDTNSD